MNDEKKLSSLFTKIVLFLGVMMGFHVFSTTSATAESIQPLSGIGITFEEQFPNAHTATVIADYFGKLPSDEIDSADLAANWLVLYSKNLTNIDGITIFSNLTNLYLGDNNFTELPASLFTMSKLQVLDVSYNELSIMPPEIGNLSNLQYLEYSRNNLVRLPEEIGTLQNLLSLALIDNQLTSIPTSIGNLSKLNYLSLGSNLLPSDYDVLLNQQGLGFTISRQSQFSLELVSPEIFTIQSQQDIDAITLASLVRLSSASPLSSEHSYQLENYHDETMQPVNIEDYLQNGRVIKAGAVYAQIRATGTGLFPNNSSSAVTQDSIQLNFDVSTFDLAFDLNGSAGVAPINQILSEGALATAVEAPTREGYTFLGWNTAQDGTAMTWDFTASAMPANNVTLYAQWQQDLPVTQYTLTFDLNGGIGIAPKTQTLSEGALATTVETPTRNGYTFLGWNTSKNGDKTAWDFTTSTMSANNVTLFAQWQENAPTQYTLSFDLNGGSGTAPKGQSLGEGVLATRVEEPIRTGYTFLGWTTTKDDASTIWDFTTSTMPAKNVTLFAQWEKIVALKNTQNGKVKTDKHLPNTGEESNPYVLIAEVLLFAVALLLILKSYPEKIWSN